MALLVVDDDTTGREVALYNLRRAGFEVDEARDGAEALSRFDPARHEVVLTDLKMPNVDGMALLRTLRERVPEVPVVVMTAFGDVPTAVEAMKAGAWDFVEKPFSRERLEITVRRAVEAAGLRRDVRRLRARAEPAIVAESRAMKEVLEVADRVAASEATALVLGESGVGKELIARRLHARSRRAAGPFVAVNCAAIPETLLESELFGHARGAFTGADRDRDGRFRRAHGGTLFLDEVGDLPAGLQGKLLRALQDGQIDVLGLDRPVAVDVRVVAATNADLAARVEADTFRRDLYFRLAVIEIRVPPLRDRVADVAPLARAFLAELADRDLALPDAVIRELESRPWPGNVRELRNAIERLAILAPGDAVRVEDLPRAPRASGDWLDRIPEDLSLVDVEREVVRHALERARWNVSEAARRLGVPRHILVYRIDKFGLKRA